MELKNNTKGPALTEFKRVPVGSLFQVKANGNIVMRTTGCLVAHIVCNAVLVKCGTIVTISESCQGYGVIGVLNYELEC